MSLTMVATFFRRRVELFSGDSEDPPFSATTEASSPATTEASSPATKSTTADHSFDRPFAVPKFFLRWHRQQEFSAAVTATAMPTAAAMVPPTRRRRLCFSTRRLFSSDVGIWIGSDRSIHSSNDLF
ncbi:hypothetical protein M6B38_377540 [Iris pallida]|uniref:Uncharacterized protein n=1 Tax=Iris pallida TaxID=29817 RepID=A0AAX6GB13_IRIPA|nr:hypothetical protein M6B38_377540 [Iris pallida]